MNKKNGSVLVLGLLVMSVILLFAGIFLSLTVSSYQIIYADKENLQADYIARAGLSKAIHDVKLNFFEKEKFVLMQKEWLKGIQFAGGTYKLGVATIIGQGVREVMIASEGILGNQRSAILGTVRIDTPSDYVICANGNANIDCNRRNIYHILGPIHSNGDMRLVGTAVAEIYWNSRLWIMKHPDLKGPVVSAGGIVWRCDNTGPGVLSNNIKSPIIIGIGTIPNFSSYPTDQSLNSLNPLSVFTLGTNNNVLPDSFIYNISNYKKWEYYKNSGYNPGTYGMNNATSPNPVYSGNKSPEVTFPVTLSDGSVEHLLVDGQHGGYTVYIPDRDKIFSEFLPFVDENWHISYTRTCGGKEVYFYNSSVREKTALSGSGSSFSFTYRGLDKISKVVKKGLWSPVNAVCAKYRYDDVNNYYAIAYPSSINRSLNNVYRSDGQLIPSSSYIVQYGNVGLHQYGNLTHNRFAEIIFGTSLPAGVNEDDHLYVDKMQNIYALSAPDSFGSRSVIGVISPITYTIDSDGKDYNKIKFKTSINGSGSFVSADDGAGKYYQTASFIQYPLTVSSVLSISGVVGSSGFYENNNLSTVTADESITYYGDESCYNKNNGIIYHTGGCTITRKPPYLYNATVDSNNKTLWFGGPPMPTKGYSSSKGGLEPADSILLQVYNKNSASITQTISNDTYIIDDNPSWVNSDAGYGKIIFKTLPTLTDPANEQFVISYTSTYREITNVNANILTPINNRYTSWDASTVCSAIGTDKEIRAIELDLSNISESNYPKDGIIFSEVPLILEGIPQKKITIVGLDEIYLNSINAPYYNTSGVLIGCTYTDDDPNAKPVGIISAKPIFIYYGLNRNNNPLNKTIEDEVFDKTGWGSAETNCVVKLNKVVLFTQGAQSYVLGGKAYLNKSIIVGSYVYPNQWAITDKELPFSYNYYIDDNITYGSGNYVYKSFDGGPQMLYANSLRKELPPHIPLTVRIKDYKGVQVSTVENFLNQIGNYLDSGEDIPQDVYMGLLQ